MVSVLKSGVNSKLDPLRFTHRQRWGTDAVSAIIHLVLQHLEDSAAYAQLLLLPSTPFLTLSSPIIQKLKQSDVNSVIIRWQIGLSGLRSISALS